MIPERELVRLAWPPQRSDRIANLRWPTGRQFEGDRLSAGWRRVAVRPLTLATPRGPGPAPSSPARPGPRHSRWPTWAAWPGEVRLGVLRGCTQKSLRAKSGSAGRSWLWNCFYPSHGNIRMRLVPCADDRRAPYSADRNVLQRTNANGVDGVSQSCVQRAEEEGS
jgi:hypothetical protein